MKVFISWSGERSRAVAELLNGWIRCVLQAARPWVSTQNIDRGAQWFAEVQLQLQDTTIGIVCLTQENKVKPWILFEAGALAKGLPASRVCTFLVDLNPSDVENPLAQFNHTLPTKDSLWQLMSTLNLSLPHDQRLHEQILQKVFDTYWPQFDQDFASALHDNQPKQEVPERPQKDILSEILENTRSLGTRVSEMERKTARPPARMIVGTHTVKTLDGGTLTVSEDGTIRSADGVAQADIPKLVRMLRNKKLIQGFDGDNEEPSS